MKCLDISFPSPEENLACDEALLHEANKHSTGPILRFWESPQHFVVLGLSNKVATETHPEQCKKDGVPILRRCSGGGTVLQGPGCLNYSLVLPISDYPVNTISEANTYIMEQNKDALIQNLPDLNVEGYTDLAVNKIKISGNAQRRLQKTILFHGTFLYKFDLSLLSKYLNMPSKEPNYRQNRSHQDFTQNIKLSPKKIKACLQKKWAAKKIITTFPKDLMQDLIATKYSLDSWNLKS